MLVTLPHLLRRWALHRGALIPAVSFAGFVASGAASAWFVNTFAVNGTCSGGGQLCNTISTFSIFVKNGGDGEGQFAPGPLTCSNLRVHFLVDATEVALTGFVGPGQKTGFVSLGFIGAGKHVVGVQAEGEVSGCNAGTLVSWAGKVKLRKGP
jgi:hypothetical protein